MAKEQRFFGASRGSGPHASRRGLLKALGDRHAGTGPARSGTSFSTCRSPRSRLPSSFKFRRDSSAHPDWTRTGLHQSALSMPALVAG